MVGILYGAIAAIFTLITFASVQERVQNNKAEEYRLRDIARTLSVNKPFIFLSIGVFMHLCASGVLASMVNYLFKYNFNKEDFIPVAYLSMFASAAVAIPLWVFILNKSGKKHAFTSGMGLLAIILSVLYCIQQFNVVFFTGLFISAGVSVYTVFFSPWAMIPDTVEFFQWKTGLRREGIIYGFFISARK